MTIAVWPRVPTCHAGSPRLSNGSLVEWSSPRHDEKYGSKAVAALIEAEPLPSSKPTIPPMFPGAAILLLAIGFAFHSSACASAPLKPPCDATTLATLTAECSAQAFECGRQGVPKAECAAIADCNARLDSRREACR